LQEWNIYQPDNEVGTWFSLNVDTFNQWRLAACIKTEDKQVDVSINNNNKSELSHFSMKPRLSEYKPFKTDKEWRAWARHVFIMAASHGCNNVFKLIKAPITPGENQVYNLQNKFMISMFSEKLFTSKGNVL
jgi:hypothetical protein